MIVLVPAPFVLAAVDSWDTFDMATNFIELFKGDQSYTL